MGLLSPTGLNNIEGTTNPAPLIDANSGIVNAALPLTGAGSPNGVVTAAVGRLYLRTDGGAGSTLWVKESGSGNTGWVAK